MKVLNFGSLNYDYVYQVEHIVKPGETINSYGMQKNPGGKGLNQSIALSRSGTEVWHAGLVGEDGDELLEISVQEGIHTDYIEKIAGRTGHTIIQVDREAQNSIVLFGGSNQKNNRRYIDQVLGHFEEGDFLLLQNEINELYYIIQRAAEKKMKIILNPSPVNEQINACNLQLVDLFFVNEIEAMCLTGEKEPEKILEEAKKIYPNADIVLTLGEKGSVFQCGDNRVWQEIFSVKAVDTTAAGDTYTGYFISGLLKKKSIEQIMRESACAAGLAVSKKGALDSIPYMAEVERVINERDGRI